MAHGVSNGHMTDDVSEVLIVTLVCLGTKYALSKKVMAFERLRVRTNVILLLVLRLFHFKTDRRQPSHAHHTCVGDNIVHNGTITDFQDKS